MKKKLQHEHLSARHRFRGSKDAPRRGWQGFRTYPPASISDHIKPDTRPDCYLHAHARRTRVMGVKVGWDYPATTPLRS